MSGDSPADEITGRVLKKLVAEPGLSGSQRLATEIAELVFSTVELAQQELVETKILPELKTYVRAVVKEEIQNSLLDQAVDALIKKNVLVGQSISYIG